MEDYPVMLYLGGLDSHAIAHDEDEADALKAKGYVEHDEAVKIEPDNTPTDSGSKGDIEDQLAEAYEHIERLEDAMEVKDKQILDLNGEIEDKDKAIAANHEHIDTLRAELSEAKNSTDDGQEITNLKESNAELEMALSGRNMALDEKNELIAELKAKLAIYEETKDVNGDGVVSYDEMTNAELQKLLEQRKVDYNKRDGKDALIKAAKDSE